MATPDFAPDIWNALMREYKNEFGVAGLMGNLFAESGLIPYRLQGDFSQGYKTSVDYTAKVDNGSITRDQFINHGPNGGGYGLAQWTYPARKRNYYDRVKARGGSIGSLSNALDMLIWEMGTSFKGVDKVLRNATSIKQASDKVLYDFENPAQADKQEPIRLKYSENIYKRFSGGPVPPGPTDLDFLIVYATRKRGKRFE